jgi:hypothetical protein
MDVELHIVHLFCEYLQAYENMKSRAKKNLSTDKVERLKTGGGLFTSQVDHIDEKVIALLGQRATPLVNQYDCDATYNNETGI